MAGLSKRSGSRILVFLAAWLSFAFTGPEIDEYQVKAMFIINFAKYVDWSSNDNESALKIGIVGESKITEALDRIAEYKKGNAKPLQILQLDPEKPVHCNIVFVARSESRRVQQLAKEFSGKGVLLISEDNNASSRAAGINLIKSDNKIKFEINQSSIKLAGLRLSGQLQQLAAALYP